MIHRLRQAFLATVCLLAFAAAAGAAPTRPRLVVLISIDQFRADYLRRFQDLFLPPEGKGAWGDSAISWSAGPMRPTPITITIPCSPAPATRSTSPARRPT